MTNATQLQHRWLASGLAGAVALCCLLPTGAQAHGAKIDYTMAPAISLTAMYDAGDPMTSAQVTVYAPNDPGKPWLTGKTDDKGRFTFAPDPSIPGEWAIQAREAGHGSMIHVTIGQASAGAASGASAPNATAAPTTTQAGGQSTLQRWAMGAAVIWGFVGTGLFFSRKRTDGHARS